MLHKKIFRFLAGFLAKKNLYITKSLSYSHYRNRVSLKRMDFVRLGMLDLAANEIYKNETPGNVAELGVYKGEFAIEINTAFKDRVLYLFDTFEGFDKRDIYNELEQGYSKGEQDFSDTSAEAVLSNMPYKEKCIIRKGFFPATAEGLEDMFAFVSIDTDLYAPILSGLEYFYPRLSPGGFIFVHDYHNNEYPGASDAITNFCNTHHIAFLPIPDNGGSAIIRKPI